ncbi:chaperonin-like RbcX protein [Klebsormidium nitens]|uniref:Chaperonin-like RbcX protein n=1 Tax=Klebsormidium nitens TaxID=105231 RepID=A0A1Y1HIR8_KLENI|nr:chaperonin-like RbcX protein [Klebsormidium nitens]|eukprot:GAQ78395.1 chaperonin-like RbcX protein [Klebsormidium nitens]
MFVPGFGEKSPEAKAADSLHNFFTFTALKIVLSQLQSYNPDAYKDLMEFAQKSPLKDGDEFVHQLMRVSPQHKTLAMRILEVRSAYASEDFEWDNVQKLSKKRMEESNTKVLREFLQQSSGMS